jgi:hypothetical protein
MLMVKSQIINLNLKHFVGHNLSCRSLNGGHEFAFNINGSKIAQWYKEGLN